MLLCVLLTLPFISGWSQDLSKSIVQAMNEPLYAQFTGTCFLKPTTDQSLLLLFNTKGSSDSYDRNLVLFSESAITAPVINEKATYEVLIPQSRRYLVLYEHGAERLTILGLSDEDASQKIKRFKENSSLTSRIQPGSRLGYGMSYMVGLWNKARVQESEYRQPFNTLDYSNSAKPELAGKLLPVAMEGVTANLCAEGKCQSGGAGSNSCSITESFPIEQQCTVNCNSGYYSCCNTTVMRCYCCRIQ